MATVCYKIGLSPALLAMQNNNLLQPCHGPGWYGHFTSAPPPVQIDCYDYRPGYSFCLAQFPIGPNAIPSGMEDGTTITVMSTSDYAALLAEEVAATTDGNNGVWTRTVLANRDWNGPTLAMIQKANYDQAILEAVRGH